MVTLEEAIEALVDLVYITQSEASELGLELAELRRIKAERDLGPIPPPPKDSGPTKKRG